jgi:Xaa-Pro aminopeptidase
MNPRLLNLTGLLNRHSLDAVLVWTMTNVRYFSGFTGTEAALVVTAGKSFFLTDSRYETQSAEQVKDFEIRINLDKSASVQAVLRECAAGRVGFEDDILPASRYRAIPADVPGMEFVPLGPAIDDLRIRKDDNEVAVMRRAAWAAKVGLENALKIIRPGITEMEVATELEIGMRRAGALKTSFDTIVGSGERGALPHGVASDKPIAEGEMIVIDFGCVLDGYCSDETVTVSLGEVGEEERRVYEIVRRAQQAALDAIRPGISLREVDKIARDIIEEAGYGKNFGHGLGHGVGMDIHEMPRVSTRTEAIAQAGMVVTVEPGIYLPGRFGVRIEDTVVITDSGCDKITSIDKNFRML